MQLQVALIGYRWKLLVPSLPHLSRIANKKRGPLWRH
jgi:hypothetical protein